jgi:hypothetical protein
MSSSGKRRPQKGYYEKIIVYVSPESRKKIREISVDRDISISALLAPYVEKAIEEEGKSV